MGSRDPSQLSPSPMMVALALGLLALVLALGVAAQHYDKVSSSRGLARPLPDLTLADDGDLGHGPGLGFATHDRRDWSVCVASLRNVGEHTRARRSVGGAELAITNLCLKLSRRVLQGMHRDATPMDVYTVSWRWECVHYAQPVWLFDTCIDLPQVAEAKAEEAIEWNVATGGRAGEPPTGERQVGKHAHARYYP